SKDQIEREFGDTLEWSCVEGRIVCAIFKEIPDGGYGDPEDTWPGIYSKMVDTMIRLEKALRPHIKNS
ncbi:MAG: DUF4268 domain-containing protein, partial [Deltaproteobacteria bacterium]|nr:DUF4268 domain-containing protein [Candidatus Zymogenaceae bacterium]